MFLPPFVVVELYYFRFEAATINFRCSDLSRDIGHVSYGRVTSQNVCRAFETVFLPLLASSQRGSINVLCFNELDIFQHSSV